MNYSVDYKCTYDTYFNNEYWMRCSYMKGSSSTLPGDSESRTSAHRTFGNRYPTNNAIFGGLINASRPSWRVRRRAVATGNVNSARIRGEAYRSTSWPSCPGDVSANGRSFAGSPVSEYFVACACNSGFHTNVHAAPSIIYTYIYLYIYIYIYIPKNEKIDSSRSCSLIINELNFSSGAFSLFLRWLCR